MIANKKLLQNNQKKMEDKESKNVKGQLNIALLFMLSLIFTLNAIPLSFAMPIPLGVDGTIYELDGITPIQSTVDFSVKNLDNGHTISGRSEKKGKYSVAISGNLGNTIEVKAWNRYNQVNTTFQLLGTLHDANLFLNMTFPPIEPIILSYPNTTALENSLWRYAIEAYDENQDQLSYALTQNPSGMIIDNSSGVLSWYPNQTHVGNHSIILSVSDGIFIVNQSFVLAVIDTNNPPVVISQAPSEAFVLRQYTYRVQSFDADSDRVRYQLHEGPNRMEVGLLSGSVLWRPLPRDLGEHAISIVVSDGVSSVFHNFSIIVRPFIEGTESAIAPITPSTGSGGGGGGGQFRSLSVDDEEPSGDLEVESTKNAGTLARNLPNNIPSLERLTYAYIVSSQLETSENGSVSYTVPRSWLETNKLMPEDVVISYFEEGTWHDAPTIVEVIDNETIYCKTQKTGADYYAITIASSMARSASQPRVSAMKQPFRISGVIYENRKKEIEMHEITLYATNMKTSEQFIAQSSHKSNGRFSMLLHGSYLDPIQIQVMPANMTIFVGLHDFSAMPIYLPRSGFWQISAMAVSLPAGSVSIAGALFSLLLLSCLLQFVFFRK